MAIIFQQDDFTRGFYTRTNNSTPDQCIVEYGTLEGYALTLEAGKKYKIHYNLLSWKGTTFTRFEIYDPNGEIVYTRVDENKGTVNGATGVVVQGSNSIDYVFYPQTTGDYKLRWTPTNANGELVEADNFDLTAESQCERKLLDCLLINLDEFDRYSSRKQSTLKNLMQMTSLRMRKAYRNHSVTKTTAAAMSNV